MKSFLILLSFFSLHFLSCTGDSTADVPSDECLMLQEEANDATIAYLDAFEAYTQDPSNGAICDNYAEALRERIEKGQALIDAGCLSPAIILTTQQAIEEDEAELNSLAC